MGVMEKMRGSTKYILWLLIFSFGILWVLADTNVFETMQAGPQSMGQVNGESISIQEYNQKVQNYTERYRQQTGESVTQELRAYYEDQAWEELVLDILLKQKMDELGIVVTDQEVVDMVTGPNPDPFIRQQFTDETGQINRQALNQAISAEENTQVWIMIEQQLRDKRRREKLANYMDASVVVTDADIQKSFINQNSTVSFEYVRVPYSTVTEDMLSYEDSDLRGYYNDNKEKYKRNKTWQISFVSWDKSPTEQDTNRVFSEVRDLREDFASTEDDSLFFLRWESDKEYNLSSVSADDIREEYRPVLDLEVGEVSEIVVDANDRLHLLKKVGEENGEVQFVDYTRGINADPISTIDAIAREADDFSFFAEEEGFKDEAERRELTVRSANATEGTPFVPGLGQSRQVMTFLESSEKGAVSPVFELPQQFVVVQVEDVILEGYRPFEDVKSQVENAYKNQLRKERVAQQVTEARTQQTELSAIATALSVNTMSAEAINYDAQFIPGAGREPVVLGAARGIELNALSEVIEGESATFVVQVTNRNEADPATITGEQQQQLSTQLEQERRQAIMNTWMEELKEDAKIKDYRHLLTQR
jgi:peptidyl-prolyl cis-trans isomerase D